MYDREEPVTQASDELSKARIGQMNGPAMTASGEHANRLSYGRDEAGPLRPANFGLEGYSSQELSLDNVVDAFTYQPMHAGQIEQAEQVREILIAAARVILRNVPRSPRRTLALQHLVNARMDANCAISFGGRF